MGETNIKKSQEVVKPANSGKGQEIQRDKKGRFIQGVSGNPDGPTPGYKQFDTLFEEAIKKIVQEKKLPIGDPEVEMVVKAVIEALKGSYAHYRDIMDRRYGKAKQPMEIGIPYETLENLETILRKIAGQ